MNPSENEDKKGGLEAIQTDDIYKEDDVPILDVRKSIFRYLLYFALAIVALSLILGFTVKITRRVQTPFILKHRVPDTATTFFF